VSSLFVMTCPRPVDPNTADDKPWPYVGATLDAIDREAVPVAAQVLFIDGTETPPEVKPEWEIVHWQRRHMALRGNKLPYFALLENAFARGHDQVLVFEDDLVFSENAVRRMVTLPVPTDCAFLQFFSPHLLPAAFMQPGIWRPPLGSVKFCQAIKYTRPTLARLIDWAENDREFGKFVQSDQALNCAVYRLQLRYGVHCPDLVDHVGEISAATPGDMIDDEERGAQRRRSSCFGDVGFDALRLYDVDGRYR
jgi:hypothetical protein